MAQKSRTLWGKKFRLVADGLSEKDVASFVDELIEKHQGETQKLSHVDSLHKLAQKTVEDAEKKRRIKQCCRKHCCVRDRSCK